MKFRSFIPALVVFLLGVVFWVIGALFKILHWEIGSFNGGMSITIASALEILGVILVVFILLRFYFRSR